MDSLNLKRSLDEMLQMECCDTLVAEKALAFVLIRSYEPEMNAANGKKERIQSHPKDSENG